MHFANWSHTPGSMYEADDSSTTSTDTNKHNAANNILNNDAHNNIDYVITYSNTGKHMFI